jgi:predicted signal transduction protein with EAL and GGDEF domain
MCGGDYVSLREPEQASILFRSILTAIVAILVVAVASAILSPLLPPAFQLTDFFSEISVLTFSLIWIFIRNQISNRGDRHTITLGIIVFSIGAVADILDEFGIGSTIRASIENFAFVGGFLLVSLGLRHWSLVSYKEREEIAKENAYLARHDALTGLRNRENAAARISISSSSTA